MKDAASESQSPSGRKRKRNSEGDFITCSVPGSTWFGAKADPLPDEPQSRQWSIEPTGASIPEGLPTDPGQIEAGHVSEEPTTVAEAFWALLERAG